MQGSPWLISEEYFLMSLYLSFLNLKFLHFKILFIIVQIFLKSKENFLLSSISFLIIFKRINSNSQIQDAYCGYFGNVFFLLFPFFSQDFNNVPFFPKISILFRNLSLFAKKTNFSIWGKFPLIIDVIFYLFLQD